MYLPVNTNEPGRYDRARVARVTVLEEEVKRLALPPIRWRKLKALLTAIEMQIEDAGDSAKVNRLLLDALRAGIRHQVGAEQGAAALAAVDLFAAEEAARLEEIARFTGWQDAEPPADPAWFTYEREALLDALERAGEQLPPALVERARGLGSRFTPALIEMALNESFYGAPETSAALWAPIHAIRILGDLAAVEAAEPLLALFGWEDDWLDELLDDAYAGFGGAALEPLRGLLSDSSQDLFTRARASSALRAVAERHPHLRDEVVAALVTRLDDSTARGTEAPALNGFVIDALLRLKERDAAPAILRAIEAGHVDVTIVDGDHVRRELGLPTLPHATPAGAFRLPAAPRLGRNQPCPCGSSLKYKRCCGR